MPGKIKFASIRIELKKRKMAAAKTGRQKKSAAQEKIKFITPPKIKIYAPKKIKKSDQGKIKKMCREKK